MSPTSAVSWVAVTSTPVAFAGDFGDVPEEEPSRPPLPPEDRLWRHPSELGNASGELALDPAAVRRRWQLIQPSRASAWSAGLAGALLATGLVALGTHLASAMTAHAGSPSALSVLQHPISTVLGTGPVDQGMGPSLQSELERVGASVTTIVSDDKGVLARSLGIIVRSDGIVLTAAQAMGNATSLTVTLDGGETYVGTLVGSDPTTGIAVVRIRSATTLPATPLASTISPNVGDLELAVTAPGGTTYDMGRVEALDMTPRLGNTDLVDAIETDLPPTSSPLGAAIIDSDGDVVGIVAGTAAQGAVVVPSWLAAPVADDLISTGSVSHGWLGIDGKTVAGAGRLAGVDLTVVSPQSAAARAGLGTGDEILAVNGARVTSLTALRARLHPITPGTSVRLIVERDGHRIGTTVVLGADRS
jgi:putative serine protease PepD